MNKEVRKITDGAMMLAIIGAAVLLDRQFAGLFSGYLLWFFPLPMVFYTSKYGLKNALPVLAASALVSLMLGLAFSSFYAICASVCGTVYGAGVHAKKDSRYIVVITMLLWVILEFLAAFVFAGVIGYDITAELQDYEKLLEMFSSASPQGEMLASVISVKTLFVMSIVTLGIMEGYITHVIAKVMLKRLRMPLPQAVPVRDWYPPKWTGYLGLACMVMYFYLFTHTLPNEILQSAGQTAGLFGTLYLVMFGVIGLWIVIPAKYPFMRGWLLPLTVFLLFGMMPALAAFGFLYIAADLHERAVKGVNSGI
ncbi:MAG TPA: hypothetical protein DHW39_04315 [Erysipelotrichaceae bacterium]|nr:hypothetical protein [Erysipelotrichaceae bacterium]